MPFHEHDYPIYLDVDDVPGIRRSAESHPEKMHPDGTWYEADDDPEVLSAVILDRDEWDELVSDWLKRFPNVEKFAAEDWAQEAGPRGGKRWRNAKNGRLVYAPNNPGGTREKKAEETPPAIDRHALHVHALKGIMNDPSIHHIPEDEFKGIVKGVDELRPEDVERVAGHMGLAIHRPLPEIRKDIKEKLEAKRAEAGKAKSVHGKTLDKLEEAIEARSKAGHDNDPAARMAQQDKVKLALAELRDADDSVKVQAAKMLSDHGLHVFIPRAWPREKESSKKLKLELGSGDDEPLNLEAKSALKKNQPATNPFVPKEPSLEKKYKREEIAAFLHDQDVVSAKPLRKGGIAEGKLLMTIKTPTGEKMRALYKPRSGEPAGVRDSISGNQAGREVAASEVANILGMGDMVPAVVMKTVSSKEAKNDSHLAEIDGEEGSLQYYIEDAKKAADCDIASQWGKGDQAAMAAAFDYVVLNTDRHAGNWLVRGNGEIALNDHGLAFPEFDDKPQWGNNMILEHARDKAMKIPAVVHKWRDKLPEVVKSLKANGLPADAIEGVERRMNHLEEVAADGDGFQKLYADGTANIPYRRW